MSARPFPVERICAQIDELFASDRDLDDALEDVARLGACLLLQAAVEAEGVNTGQSRHANALVDSCLRCRAAGHGIDRLALLP